MKCTQGYQLGNGKLMWTNIQERAAGNGEDSLQRPIAGHQIKAAVGEPEEITRSKIGGRRTTAIRFGAPGKNIMQVTRRFGIIRIGQGGCPGKGGGIVEGS